MNRWLSNFFFDEDIKKNMENSSKVLGNVVNHIFEMSLHHHLSIQKKSSHNELKT